MILAKVYLETSFFSECCTVRTGDIARGRRATSLNWWNTDARKFELFISDEVIRELSRPEFPEDVRGPAMDMLHDLAALALTPEVFGIAAVLVSERVMPGPAVEGDAVHLAAAIVHRINYMLTWNQKHLANPNKRTHLLVVCSRLGYLAPEIVTPDLMILENRP
jgi:predicted nucleic acid-binding protein